MTRTPGMPRLILLAACAARPGLAAADEPKPPTPLSAEQKAANVESFDQVWKTIRDTFYDPKLNGVDWDAARAELRPKVEAADTPEAARDVLRRLVYRLKVSHFQIFPADVYGAVASATSAVPGDGESGVDVRVFAGKALVTAVRPGSGGDKAGVKAGWVVESVRGQAVGPSIEKVAKAYGSNPLGNAYQALTVMAKLHGSVGESVPVVFLDADDKPAPRDIPLGEPTGVPARFANLPTFHVRFESATVHGSVGYVSLNAFFDPVRVMPMLGKAVEANRGSDGMIVDLRGNPGGIAAMAMGFGGWFATVPDQKLGTMSTRAGSLNFVLNPRPEPFAGPVAVLVDCLSLSTSEILAGGLHDLGRVRVFGTPTGGAALPSRVDRLPNGDGFQYAFANYISVGGKPLEGLGLVPDVEVIPDRAALLAGRDPAVDAAAAWIKGLKKAPEEAKAR